MEKKLLSFIIPVYNVESYLKECVESITSQDMEGCEVILVDDGSTDASGAICDELKDKFDYIAVIHQKNGGSSAARNMGLKVASGDYIAFIDSDDRIVAESVPKIKNWINQGGTDFCFMEGIKFYPNGKKESMGDGIEKQEIARGNKTAVMKYLSTREKFPGSPCTKIFRKDFLQKHELWFPKDRRLCEDLGFIRDCLLSAESYDVLDFPYYEYRQSREGSNTSLVTMRSFHGLGLFIKESVEKLTHQKKEKNEIAAYAMSFVAYEYCILLWQHSRLSKEEQKQALDFLKEYAWVLKFGKSRKTKLIKRIMSILGIVQTTRLLDCYMKLREKNV